MHDNFVKKGRLLSALEKSPISHYKLKIISVHSVESQDQSKTDNSSKKRIIKKRSKIVNNNNDDDDKGEKCKLKIINLDNDDDNKEGDDNVISMEIDQTLIGDLNDLNFGSMERVQVLFINNEEEKCESNIINIDDDDDYKEVPETLNINKIKKEIEIKTENLKTLKKILKDSEKLASSLDFSSGTSSIKSEVIDLSKNPDDSKDDKKMF
ncbi:hypothetical protein RCL_jg16386.t1 [Rhizophagus clarus]|uniref:Uncharacterized protein n=1 Tax=Rhizophagus clarus TaxID=94130 RepID=A0A8H3QZF8_9GLOM|nr:hypothetical protein RCL_jg16386.t1 [Rhizophagus clarus]